MSTRKQSNAAFQFSLRSVLAAMSILSVLLAVLLPHIRTQPPEVRRHLWWTILVLAVFATIGLAVLCVRRWRVETLGGDLLLRPKHSAWLDRGLPLGLVAIFGGLLAYQCVVMVPLMNRMAVLDHDLRGPGLGHFGWYTTISLAPLTLALVYALVLLWWRVTPLTLEIRENGIGFGGLKFVPWKTVAGYEWMDGKHGLRLTILSAARKRVTVISFGDREAVQRFLDAKMVRA